MQNMYRSPTSSSITSLLLFPLYSWYHAGFDTEPELNDKDFLEVDQIYPFERRWGDFSMCHWPSSLVKASDVKSIHVDNRTLAYTFAALNEHSLSVYLNSEGTDRDNSIAHTQEGERGEGGGGDERRGVLEGKININKKNEQQTEYDQKRCHHDREEQETVISFSHFVPRQELCPEKRFLVEPYLPRVIGSDVLEHQVRRLHPHLHLFGHTHIPIDITLEGQRYVQWCLGYPREATKQCADVYKHGPLLVYDSSLGVGANAVPSPLPSESAYWSVRFRTHSRQPQDMTLSPWLRTRLEGYKARIDGPNPLTKLLEAYQTNSSPADASK
eukprot:CAMPEP_0182435214 /NCGR_PEP_ID=MMETSP1167-20130531/74423_1 /TAXON_ID=2988 /ORGANISM="Mallomonas Sp, Strain CCMP3275" /LENGTH=327 /DNA_ID=CAMNT_0024626001 /DNA_START=120 /DNA_END=1103 /DNA_ORIENTATION=-